jgi:hypothetical protein
MNVIVSLLAVALGACAPMTGADDTQPGDEEGDEVSARRRACGAPLACDAAPPPAGSAAGWRHFTTSLFARAEHAHHRGRDVLVREGEPQWALAKFAYGVTDKDLEDEDVDVYVLRSCTRWERLGTTRTTHDGDHATVEGVEDSGGRVYFEVPAARRLGPGRHRLHFVARGDLTTADAWIDVVPADARVVVSDVDGTLTASENAELWTTLVDAPSPEAHPGAPDALRALARRGYHVLYLTARAEWLAPRTHEWLAERGFPPGIVHTTLGLTGATGAPAQRFKTAELAALVERLGRAPDYAFGNTTTDVGANDATGIDPSRAFFYQLDGELRGGHRLEDYRTLVAGFDALPSVCQ